MSDSPAEADKSFLLPLTSSILRAQELISEPGLEASPFAQNNNKKKSYWGTPVKKFASPYQNTGVLNLPLNTNPNPFLVRLLDGGKF